MELPQYIQRDSGISLGPTPQADTRPRDERSSSLAPGLNALSQGLNSLASGQQYAADALKRQQEQQDLTRTNIAISGAHAALEDNLAERRKAIFNDPNGIDPNKFNDLTGQMHTDVMKAYQTIADQATTQKGKNKALETGAAFWADHYMPKAKALQADAGVTFARSNIVGSIKNFAASAANDPDSADALIQFTEGSIDQADNLPWTERQEWKDKARNGISWSAANRLVVVSPELFSPGKKHPIPAISASGITGSTTSPQTYATADTVPIEGTPSGIDNARADIAAESAKGPVIVNGVVIGEKPPTPTATRTIPPTDAEIADKVPFWNNLTLEQKLHIRTLAASQIDQGNALQQKQVSDHVHEEITARQNNFPYSTPVTPEELAILNNPKVTNDLNLARRTGAFRDQLSKMPVNEQGAAIDQYAATAAPDLAKYTMASVGIYNGAVKEFYGNLSKEQRVLADSVNTDVQTDFKLAQRGLVPDTPIPDSRFEAAFGKDAGSAIAAYKSVIGMGKVIKDLPTMTPEQQDTALKPYILDPNDRESARNNIQVLDSINTAMREDQKARNKDIGLHTLQARGMGDSFMAALQDGSPDKVRGAIQNLYAQELSLNPNAQVQLPLAVLNQVGLAMNKQQNKDTGDTYVSRLEGLEKVYGPYFADLTMQMQKNKIPLPSGIPTILMASRSDGSSRPVQVQIALSADQSIKDYEKLLEGRPGIVGPIKTAIDQGMVPFNAAMGQSPENFALQDDVRTSAVKLALAEAAKSTASPTDIAGKVLKQILGNYSYMPQSGTSYTAMIPADQDPEQVMRGAAYIKEIVPNMTLKLPVDRTGLNRGIETEEQYKAHIREYGFWTVNNNGTGLDLMTTDAAGYPRKVMGPSNVPVGFSWQAMRERANLGRSNLVMPDTPLMPTGN